MKILLIGLFTLAGWSAKTTIEILFMLLVAAITGYITAWLYYKSFYTKKLISVESDKHELNNRIVNLHEEIFNLKNSPVEYNKEIENPGQEIRVHNLFHTDVVQEADVMRQKNKSNEQLAYERDEALMHIARGKKLLDYKSFGTAVESEKDDLQMISGIGPLIEERLYALDIYTFRQISRFTLRDIETINDAIVYFSGRIDRDKWVEQAAELVHREEERLEVLKRISRRKGNIYYDRIGKARKEEADNLTVISGIGGWIMEKLNVLDIYTFRQISRFTLEDIKIVTEAIEYFPGRIEWDEWILQAHDLLRIAGNKSELLKRIRGRKGRIYFGRLGTAHKHEADNLTLIDGLGLWVEERLNTLGIYTFNQISKLRHRDIATITEVLEIKPGRIEKDDWVVQAQILSKKYLMVV